MTQSQTVGALFLIAERQSGEEYFLGRATGQSDDLRLALEGKALLAGTRGEMTVQPFATRAEFRLDDASYRIQRVDHPDAVDEVTRVLTLAIAGITRDGFPLLARWFGAHASEPAGEAPGEPPQPFQHLIEEFRAGAERCRRALILSPQVTGSQELDRLVELEGDLAIELGKVANGIATALNRMLESENELAHFLRRVGAPAASRGPGSVELGGWRLCAARLSAAKNWAVSRGETTLVRDLGVLLHEGHTRVGQVLLEHQSALDTLASEAFGRYGVQPELLEAPVSLSREASELQRAALP